MPKNPDKIETMANELGCTGKRVTKELIESRIELVDYQTVVVAGQKLMYCGIKMDNGFTVVGKPATCMDPANWRDEIGREVSYDNSFAEIWRLEAYRMMSEDKTGPTTFRDRLLVERADLIDKIEKLISFQNTGTYDELPAEEQRRLCAQLNVMVPYEAILKERIEALSE